MNDTNQVGGVYVWSGKDKQLRRVTDKYFDSAAPAWDPDGNYLYFLSTREFAPLISGAEFNFATTRDRGIFAMALRKDVKHPFPPQSDEVAIAKEETKTEPGEAGRTESGRRNRSPN